ncbi:uncharacterized protein [Procambarus clarkii]|uniref:uncharacterized protein n=1 Tax=Procambarus clarkii TaxID=6728 RepID=UPI001E6765DA|nr:alpha-N-acetylgalactosamine-specific lectin-like [Procambarus clarkii]
MRTISTLTLVLVAASAWAQYHIRRDGTPIIFGGSGDATMAASPGLLVVAPRQEGSPQPPQPAPRPQPQPPVPAQDVLPQRFQLSGEAAPLNPFQASLCDAKKPLVDEVESGRAYHLSWCHDSGRTYTWEQASRYCAALGHGFQALSIETQPEQHFIATIIVKHYVTDIWTSGNKINNRFWVWASGVASTYTNWSLTGRRGVPQPDNTEGNEDCLAVLNNHYNDGVSWHDSSCYRFRRVICEAPQFYKV